MPLFDLVAVDNFNFARSIQRSAVSPDAVATVRSLDEKSEMEPWRVSMFGDRLHVVVDDPPAVAIRDITGRLTMHGFHVADAYEEPPSIEDIFIALVERLRSEGKTAQE